MTYANVLYKANRLEEFEQTARAALELDPRNNELLMMVYTSARGRGDMKTALDALLAVKELGVPGDQLLPHLDFVAKKMGRSPDAIPAYQAVLEVEPNNVDACVALASIYTDSGNSRQSDEYLARAVELAPQRAASIYLEMGSTVLNSPDLSDGELAHAIALLRKAIELEPSSAPAYKRLGLALWKREDWAGTRAAFEKYLELNPDGEDKDQIDDYLSRLPE